MCGITGIYHFDRDRAVDRSRLGRMTASIAHRGPDGEGFHVDRNVGLGHRRLTIIDLDTGDQPMHDRSGRSTIIFNGEIYNYIELRDELKALGRRFITGSDTEVVLQAYGEWGEACQEKLNGMWAFALWDSAKRALFLSRDRIGEKPLYYAVHDETFLFGSEIKTILEYGHPREANTSLLELYLFFSYIPAPHTFFKGIRQLRAGHSLTVSEEGVREKKYWDLPETGDDAMFRDRTAVYGKFESLLTDSVRIRMRSDVPYGAFLSGGLDSSCIVALMSQISDRPVETFTIGFDEKAFDERPLARLVAEKFDTSHHEERIAPEAFDEALDKVHHHYDDLFGDSSAIPTGHVSKYAREQVKMVLTGDGGDEVLSGYTIYQGEKFAGRYGAAPAPIRTFLPAALATVARFLSGAPRYRLNRAINVFRSSSLDFEERLIHKVAFADPPLIRSLLENAEGDRIGIREFISDVMGRCPYKDPFYRLMYFHLKISLPGDMLTKVDRMSMAHSLEARVPFLDPRLIEFMTRVHKDVKMERFERKSVLRRTVGRRLPARLLRARKKGFGVPLREWFKGKEFDAKLRTLADTGLGLNERALSAIVADTVSGKKDYGNFIWMLFVARRWMAP